MGLLFSPSQKEHFERGRQLYLSEEAKQLRNDPDVSEIQEIAALSHFLKSWKELGPRYGKKDVEIYGDNGEFIRKGKNELTGLGLVPDNETYIDPLESKQFEIEETKRYQLEGEIRDAYHSMSPEEREWFRGLIIKHIDGGAIDAVGELGTKQRMYPTNYEIAELQGKKIPAIFEPGQKRGRGVGLMLDGIEQIDPDTGVGTFGMSKDALHREAAANAPQLLTDQGNIRLGNSSLNQSVKDYEGVELANALTTRSNRLNSEEFELENGVRAAPPDVKFGKEVKRDNRLHTDLENNKSKEFDQLIEGVRALNSVLG